MKNFFRGIFTGGLIGVFLSAMFFGEESNFKKEENSRVLGLLKKSKISKIKNILDE